MSILEHPATWTCTNVAPLAFERTSPRCDADGTCPECDRSPEEAARLIQERGFRRVYTWPQT